jgi:hypothetical protein
VANYTLKEGGDYEATCIVCVDTGRVRVVYVDKRVTKDVDGVLINLGETYTGQEIWKPEVVRLSCADAADQATSIAEIAYTRSTNGSHAHVQDFLSFLYKGVQPCGL